MDTGTSPRVTCTVAWESAALGVQGWHLEQCHNVPGACRWDALASVDALTFEAIIDGLQTNQSQCWRVQVVGGDQNGQVSNIVCR